MLTKCLLSLVAWLNFSGELLCTPENFTPDKPAQKLSEKDCLELSKYIIRTWKMAAILLGFDVCDIDEIEMNHYGNCRIQATAMLIKWTQRKVDQANLNNLLPIFERLSSDFPRI